MNKLDQVRVLEGPMGSGHRRDLLPGTDRQKTLPSRQLRMWEVRIKLFVFRRALLTLTVTVLSSPSGNDL